jgi:hypothetical protein
MKSTTRNSTKRSSTLCRTRDPRSKLDSVSTNSELRKKLASRKPTRGGDEGH